MKAQRILITGCSSGIGLAAAVSLKVRGHEVFASARKREDVQKLKDLGLKAVLLDVTQAESRQAALQEVLNQTDGQLDVLFNNSGIMIPGAIEDLSAEMIQEQFLTNVFAPIALTQLVLPVMRRQGGGRIIQNSSVLGFVTMPFYGAYNASKFALEGFSNTLRQELRNTNIKVIIINPGPIKSKLRLNAYHKYQQTLKNNPHAVFAEKYKHMEENYFKQGDLDQVNPSPDLVSKILMHAIENKHPKSHYYIGTIAKVMAVLKRILPDRGIDWLVSKA